MTSLFEEFLSKEEEETNIIGGVSLRIDKRGTDMPTKRFENLVVPMGLQIEKLNMIGGIGVYGFDPEGHAFMDEGRFSKLFYSVAKDLGSGKSRKSSTKKNRR
jgi:hypothetical protein